MTGNCHRAFCVFKGSVKRYCWFSFQRPIMFRS